MSAIYSTNRPNTTAAIFAEAHARTRMGLADKTSGITGTYRSAFAEILRGIWKQEKITRANAREKAEREAQVAETFVVALQYSQNRQRDAVKRLGGKWNGSVWTVSCKRWEMEKAGLMEFVVTGKPVTAPAVAKNTNLGYAGKVPAWTMRAGLEFDGIEG